MISYLKVRWHHDHADEPVLLFSEIEHGREVRKVEQFADGHTQYAGGSGDTTLAETPMPEPSEIARDPSFTVVPTDAAEFEAQWWAAVHPTITDLLGPGELPTGFSYPVLFRRLVNLGLLDLEPWQILFGELLRRRHSGLAHRYPSRRLVPFARRQDNDDVACWDLDRAPGGIAVIHDYASPGWERRAEYADLADWLRRAVEDLEFYEVMSDASDSASSNPARLIRMASTRSWPGLVAQPQRYIIQRNDGLIQVIRSRRNGGTKAPAATAASAIANRPDRR